VISGTTVTNDGGSWTGAAADVYGGTDLTKSWEDSGLKPIKFDFVTPNTIVGFSFKTSEDSTDKDPVRWRVEASIDGMYWMTVHDMSTSDYATTTNRSCDMPIFYFNFENKAPSTATRDSCAPAAAGFQDFKRSAVTRKVSGQLHKSPTQATGFGKATEKATASYISTQFERPLRQTTRSVEKFQAKAVQRPSTLAAAAAPVSAAAQPLQQVLAYHKYIRFRPLKTSGSGVATGPFVLYDELRQPIETARGVKASNMMGTWTGKAADIFGPAARGTWEDAHASALVFAFAEPRVVTGLQFKGASGPQPLRWKIEGSANGTYWETLVDQSQRDVPVGAVSPVMWF
jgi:hypothetical protein